MTDCLDDNGFFTIPAEEVAQKTGVPEAEVSWTLKVLQELEPLWDFRTDLKHSLLKQLEMQGLKMLGQSGGEGTPAGCGRWKDQCHF